MSSQAPSNDLNLLRLATIYLDPAPKRSVDWVLNVDNASLKVIRSWELEGKRRLLIGSVVSLQRYPDVNAAGAILIPEDARKAAEKAIETFAHLLSIGEMTHCSISSPTPYIGLLPLSENSKSWLDSTKGIAVSTSAQPSFRFSIPLEALEALSPDRLPGAALLAEVFAHAHPIGKLHECIRVFELAFAKSSTPLVSPLSEFLSTGTMGYTKAEVQHWITVIRHQATHADLKTQPAFLLSADVRRYISRMQQAAYDVLFNKSSWHDPSTTRRSLWSPDAYVATPDGRHMTISQGSAPTFESQLIDGFGAYPVDLSAGISPVPPSWWCKLADKAAKSG